MAERVHRQLLDDISQGRWSREATVSAYALARRMAVSRTPVVEALKRLEAEGLIEIVPRVGARLRTSTPEAAEELYSILANLLGLAAERGASRVDGEWLERMDALVQDMDEATKDGDVARHRWVSGQVYLGVLRLGLPENAGAIEPIWRLMRAQAGPDPEVVNARGRPDDLRAIIDALRIRSPLRARAAAERHITSAAPRGWDRPSGWSRQRPADADRGLDHSALLYRSPSEFLATVLPFVLEGLRRDEPVLVALPPENAEVVADALGSDASRILLEDSRDWYDQPAATLRRYRDHIERYRSSTPVRIIGEPTWKTCDESETVEWLRYEAVLNVALESSPATILCPYDAGRLPSHILDGARAAHPKFCESGCAQASPHYQAFFTTTSPSAGALAPESP